jgi:recombination protein RecA
MPATARAELESLLRARKLDRTLTTALPSPPPEDERWLARTGIPELDARLGGGIPRGQLSEFIGPRSSGRLTVLLSALAAATERGEAVALVDPLDMLDPESASAAGVDLTRLLWIRGEAPGAGRSSLPQEYGWLQTAVDRALKALDLVLQAGGFGVVALDLAEVAPQVARRIPFTTWLRVQRAIEGSETACVLIGSEPMARSPAGLTVALRCTSRRSSSEDRARAMFPRALSASVIDARVIRARAMETDRDVCLRVSPAVS